MENLVLKRAIRNLVLCMSSSGALLACGGAADSSGGNSKMLADGEACQAAWVSTTAYNGGALVSRNGRNYSAAYWTQNQDPSVAGNSGASGSGAPWITGYLCGSTPTPTPTPAPTPTPTPAPTPAPTPTPTPAPTPAPTPTPTPAPTPAPTPTGTCPQYVSGHTYVAGDKVTNAGGYYQCTVGGWCSTGGAYDPGTGWAWTNAWTQITASQCGGTPTPTPTPAPTPAPTPTPTPAPTPAPTPTPTPAPTPAPTPTPTPAGCSASAPGPCADQSKRAFTGYYPSWSDNWFTVLDSNNNLKSDAQIYSDSKLAKVPAQFSHVQLSFADPNFSWGGLTANNWSGTGINFNGMPKDIKEVIRILHERNIKVVLAVGGANYNNWTELTNEAGVAMGSAPVKTALKNFMVDMGVDGLDVDYEIAGDDDTTATNYAHAIQAMREAVDAAGAGHILTLAGWSTGADCIASTSGDSDCAGKISYWTGSAGRERLAFKKTLTNNSSKTIASLLDVVSIMSYDAQTYHYDPAVAYDQYRRLLPSSTIVSIGLETAKEGWAGGKLMINDADATCDGSIITADQYGVANKGNYTVQREGTKMNGTTTNARDGLMLWSILKVDTAGPDTTCGSLATATPAQVADKVRVMFGLPTQAWPY